MEEILKKLHLSKKEAEIYLALLKIGQSSSSQIAAELNLPRQTIYSVLEKLIEDGFVEQSDKRGVKQFFADPNQLLALVEKQKEELERSKQTLKEEIPKILAENKRGGEVPIVQYYEGQEGLRRLFENILKLYQKGKSKTFRGYGINLFYPGLEKFLQDFVEKRSSFGVDTNLFIAEGPDGFGITDETSALKRDIKRLSIEPQQAGIYIAGNQIYLFSYKDNIGVLVENQAIARFMKDAFDDHWEKTA
jgi:sugar-specific transcriptional regulator TrmB